MKGLTKLLGITAIGAVIAIGTAGCDNPAGGGGGGGGSIDGDLVATWHLTQAAADNEEAPVFEIASDGSFIGNTGQGNDLIKVAASNGRISSTITAGGTTSDAGSADYVVKGTALTFSNLSGPPNIFLPLYTAASMSGGSFYKKGSGNGGNGGAKILVIRNIPADVYSYGALGGVIGVFQSGTTPEQALAQTGIVAGNDLQDGGITVDGSGPYTMTVPLYNAADNYSNRWTGSGTYDIYVALYGGGGHSYRVASVNISSGTTYIAFSSATEITQ